MTPLKFKSIFLTPTKKQQKESIEKMSKDYLTGVAPKNHKLAIKGFADLLEWCKLEYNKNTPPI